MRTPTFTIANPRRAGWPLWFARLAGAGLAFGVTAAAIGALTLYTALATDLPALDSFDSMAARGVTRFEAADGSLVGERYQQRRLALRWEDFPPQLVLAFLAAEDERFFDHAGLDFRGILRAMVTNLVGGREEGASTITQQLAKTLVGNERSYTRKVKEAILARRMEDLYTKEQILTWYLNLIYLGHNSYGVQAAAQNYFRKNVWELSLAEMALLASVPQSPSRVNPAADMAATRRRMNLHVLPNMVSHGWATQAEVDRARGEEVTVYPLRDRWNEGTPEYTEAVRQSAEPSDCSAAERADAEARGERCVPAWPWGKDWLERGLTIRMAVEPAAQRVAAAALGAALEELQKKQGYPGPLGNMERDAFLARNARWVSTEAGERVLARVASVEPEQATLEVGLGIQGTLALKDARWAAPYSEQPLDAQGHRVKSARVSFGGVLKDLSRALTVGDVVLVEVLPPPTMKAPTTKPGSKPTTKNGKKDPLPLPSGPPPLEFALVPVPLVEGALAATNLTNDGLEAMVGTWDFDRSEVNRVNARRATASTIKGIVYAKAYDMGMPPSEVQDMGVSGRDLMPAWRGLLLSDNNASANVFTRVRGHEGDAAQLAEYRAWGKKLGLPYELEGHRSDILGAEETPLAMLRAYATFARQGRMPELDLVREVSTREGTILERHYSPLDPHARADDTWIAAWHEALHAAPPVISPTTAYLITRNLAAVVASGTATGAKQIGREAAGKTGTNDYDVWFVGFSGARAAVAWLGTDRRERTLGPSEDDNRVHGASAALPAWVEYMRRVDPSTRGDKKPGVAPEVPPDVVDVRIDPASGLLMPPDSEGGLVIPHRKGTEPTDVAPPPVTDP